MAMTAKAREIRAMIAWLQRELDDEIDDELATIRSTFARYRKAQNLWEGHFTVPCFEEALAPGFELRRASATVGVFTIGPRITAGMRG